MLTPSWNRGRMRGLVVQAAAIAALVVLIAGVAFAADGTINSLSATDAPTVGQTITISASYTANTNISNSNVTYTILAPDGVTVVATHTTNAPSLNPGDTFSDSWTTTNTSFPSVGTYTLKACWSPGNSTNCTVDQKSTSFYSVPTLNSWLWLVVLVLLIWFLRQRRNDFKPSSIPGGVEAGAPR